MEAKDYVDLMARRLDYTYWAIVEISTAIMCANLPAMSSLIRHINRSSFNIAPWFLRYRSHGTTTGTKKQHSSTFHRWIEKPTHALYNTLISSRGQDSERKPVSEIELTDKADDKENDALNYDLSMRPKATDYSVQITAQEDREILISTPTFDLDRSYDRMYP